MRRQNAQKLKWVLDHVPHGYLIDTPTLERNGVTRKLAYKYIESGWLEPVVRGLYRRPDPSRNGADWPVVVRSLQHLMGYESIVGGRTALELQGFDHYIQLRGETKVHLYGENHPSWLKRLESEADYVLHGTKLFVAGEDGHRDVESSAGMLHCSSPERAILELLDELPHSESFHIVDTVFEGLASARPKQLMELLGRCRSVKVKRLFFVFADRHHHAWRKHLSAEDIDLGSGDRALVEGGKLHPVYRITVPPDLMPNPDEDTQGA